MNKKKKKSNNLISMISLGMIFSSMGLIFLVLSIFDGFGCFLIMAISLIVLGAIMLGYYLALSKKK